MRWKSARGISAAVTMARAGLSVVVLERGEYPGAKNVQGAVMYPRMLHEIVPEFWKDKVVGIKTDEDELLANVVIACDGVNAILAQKAGYCDELKPQEVALGAKEVLELSPEKIEDRFCLQKGEGVTMETLGAVTYGMLGCCFLYPKLACDLAPCRPWGQVQVRVSPRQGPRTAPCPAACSRDGPWP